MVALVYSPAQVQNPIPPLGAPTQVLTSNNPTGTQQQPFNSFNDFMSALSNWRSSAPQFTAGQDAGQYAQQVDNWYKQDPSSAGLLSQLMQHMGGQNSNTAGTVSNPPPGVSYGGYNAYAPASQTLAPNQGAQQFYQSHGYYPGG